MRRLLFLGVGSALMFTMGGVGTAYADGGPHKTTVVGAGMTATMDVAGGGRCASCHRAHTAKAENLLKQAQPALCYSCHSSLGANNNVVDGVEATGDTLMGLRGGGFEYALINGAAASKTMSYTPSSHGVWEVASRSVPVGPATKVTSSHQVDGTTTGTMWGNGAISDQVNPGKADVLLECSSCHDPHGNGNYRILKPIPNDANNIVTPAIKIGDIVNGVAATVAVPAVMSITTGVNIPDALSHNYTTEDYWNVADRTVPPTHAIAATATTPKIVGALAADGVADGYIANVAAWCTTCHTRYLAGSGSSATALKDSSGQVDATFTYRHRSDASDRGGANRPNCIQCHVSHGSNVTMTSGTKAASVPFPGQVGTGKNGVLAGPTSATTGVTAQAGYGDSKLLRVNNRGTCVMCHNV